MSESKKTPYQQGSYERMITRLTSTQGDDSENNEDLEAANRKQSSTQQTPEEYSVGPLSPPKRTKSGSSAKKKSKKTAKESKKSVLQAPKQHIDMGKPKSPKREKKESSSPKKPPPEKLSAENSIPLAPPKSTSPPKKKNKKKKKKAPAEKTHAKKIVDIDEDKKMPPQKAKTQNAMRTDPSPKSDKGADKSIEKTRVTTRAAISSLASSTSRSVNNKSRIGTISENESHNYDGDGDHSVSTAPLPPSLRVQDHHSLRPGAYRMYTGGVARYVDSAGDDIDDNYSTSNDQSTAQYTTQSTTESTTQSTNYSHSLVANTIDAVTIEAHLVEDPPPPVFRPAPSEAITADSNMAITYATVNAIEDEEIEKDDADGSWTKKRIQFLVCFGVFAIVIIASIVAASVLRRNRGGNKGNLNVDDLSDSMKEFIAALPQYTIVSLANERSDQSKALDWIEEYDDLDSFSLERNLQRFALISLLFAISNQDLGAEVLTWLASRDECDWYESVCVDDIYTQLSLQSENQFTGTIVPELALLTSLEILLVDGNALGGTIPTELGELTNLQILRMNDNFFEGQIPREFGNLSNLEEIDLSVNNLSGVIPTEIGSWTMVEIVRLENNYLSGTMPTEIGKLAGLENFSVASNDLEGQIPSSVSIRLMRMERFNVEKNRFSGRFLPDVDVEFDGGFLERTGSLKYLNLGDNDFTGTLGTAIGLLKNLEEFDVSKNQMKSHLPTEFGLMTSLTRLRLNSNQFDDSIPTEMGLLTNLKEMILHHNLFTGTLPFDICGLPYLERDGITIDCARVFCLCCHCGPRGGDQDKIRDKPPPTNDGSPLQGIPPPPMNGGSGSRP